MCTQRKDFSEEEILKYMKKRNGYVTDNDFHIKFIQEESAAFFSLHNTIDLLVNKGKILKTKHNGYELKK